MNIDYSDGSSVVAHLGDLNPDNHDKDVCWLKINNEWVRSPFDTCSTTCDYLLSLQTANQIQFSDIPERFKSFIR